MGEKDLYRKWTSQVHRQWTPCRPRQARQSPFFTYYIPGQVKRRRNKSPTHLTSPSFMFIFHGLTVISYLEQCLIATNKRIYSLWKMLWVWGQGQIANGLFSFLHKDCIRVLLKTRKRFWWLTSTLTWHQVSFHCSSPVPSQQLSLQGDITYPLDLYARESCCFCGCVSRAFWTLLLVEMGSRLRCQVPTPNSWFPRSSQYSEP